MIADRSEADRARDGRLAWLIVAGCTVLTLTLVTALVVSLRGPVRRMLAEAWAPSSGPRQIAAVPPDTAKPIGDPGSWITPQNRPFAALARGEHGTVRVTLAVSPSGQASGCQVAQSSGYDSLDNGTCLALMGAARFEPARAGEPGSRPGEVRRWTSPVVTWRE